VSARYSSEVAVAFAMHCDMNNGGPPITRLAARLWDAEREGCVFECIGRRSKCKIWRLVSKPDVERAIDSLSPIPAEEDQGRSGAPVDGPLNADVDDGRRGVPGRGLALAPSPGPGAPAAVVNTDTLFEVEPEKPQSPYDLEAA
jgi:hypothetical protein